MFTEVTLPYQVLYTVWVLQLHGYSLLQAMDYLFDSSEHLVLGLAAIHHKDSP